MVVNATKDSMFNKDNVYSFQNAMMLYRQDLILR